MKTKSILFSMFFAVTAFVLFSNCGGNKKEDTTQSHEHDANEHTDSTMYPSGSSATAEASQPQFAVDVAFQAQLADVLSSYLKLKEAFVSSDAGKVKAESSTTQASLGKIDMKLVDGVAHVDWMNYRNGLETALKEIQSADDIEAQRKAFSSLSEHLYKSIKAYGLGGTTAFYTYCPMAFNNQGAFWLSSEEKIRNPYFGDQMLTCGEVKEKLK